MYDFSLSIAFYYDLKLVVHYRFSNHTHACTHTTHTRKTSSVYILKNLSKYERKGR